MRTNHQTLRTFASAAAMSLALAGAGGCEQASAVAVSGNGEAFNRSAHQLSLGSVLEFSGSYGAGCVDRSGQWSVATTTLSSMTNPALSVVRNNTACQLSLEMMRIGPSEAAATMLVADDPIQLGATFKPVATAFRIMAAGAVTLYANFRVTPDIAFGSNFSIQGMYSDDPTQAAADVSAIYEVVSSSASAADVPPPNYGTDASSLSLKVDAAKLVTQASGAVQLIDMVQPGESYVISNMDFGAAPSYGDVDQQFSTGTQTAISGVNPVIAAADLNLIGADLNQPLFRSIIIAHAAADVRSYQVIAIRFLGP